MLEPVPSPLEKALALNLDPLKYGTIVEIGAGQEVARWFFQAGAAAGTIAKTMSAYDMKFSDEIYGVSSDKRYVSRARLEGMLEHEFDLILERVENYRPEGSTFFAFANTVSAQGYNKQDECHGWLGVRLQSAPHAPADDIVIHVRMLDDTNVEQQEALGILGVNLIYGAFFHAGDPALLLRSLMDNIKWGRVEIDLIEFNGATLGAIDNGLMALELVKASLARAVMFDPKGNVVIPADALYKHSVLAMRGDYQPVCDADMAIFDHAKARFLGEVAVGEQTVFLAEMTMAKPANDTEIDTGDFLSRVHDLTSRGFHVLISEFFRYFRVRQYFARYTNAPVAIVTDVNGFADIMREDYYEGLSGGLLEALGQLFPRDTTLYVFPGGESGTRISLDTMPIASNLRPLVTYLRDGGMVVPIDDFDPA